MKVFPNRLKKMKNTLQLVALSFICFQISTISADGFNPYSALELSRSATQNEIRKAYKRLVMEWHPDRNNSPDAEKRFLVVNRAYKILSSAEKREAFDKFGLADEDLGDSNWRTFTGQQFFQEQQQHFQYVRWPPPSRKQQQDFRNFVLPFASVFGTLFFIFLIGFVLNQMNTAEANNKRRRQSNRAGNEEFSGNVPASASNSKTAEGKDQEWHPEDPKTPLTEEEKQQRQQARIWRTMGPLIHELRAETQFGLIRLLKPGCRSIIILVDRESKDSLLQQFARYTYCLRNNKTFSFGFLFVPKNLNWFRSLLELTLPIGEMPGDGPKDDSASVSTATTDTNSNDKIAMDLEKEPEEKMGVSLGQFTNERKMEKTKGNGRKMSAKDRLKNINPKHTLGTVFVICGWKLYFSIYHPMHRPAPRNVTTSAQLETLGHEEAAEEEEESTQNDSLIQAKKKESNSGGNGPGLNVENVLNGFPTFLERLLEGTIRRYYIPEWPDNLV